MDKEQEMDDRLRAEFGDYQTPLELCDEVLEAVARRVGPPATVVEPTCGVGHFLDAAARKWPSAHLVARERNAEYVEAARAALLGRIVDLRREDFFQVNWRSLIARHTGPLAVIGNPPWVTNTDLAVLQSQNAPDKRNLHGHRGIEAKTGKANFDISEWMSIQLIEAANGQAATIALLLKTHVARKVLSYAWRRGLHLENAEIRNVDAKRHFDASVSACLLVVGLSPDVQRQECDVFDGLREVCPSTRIGWRSGFLVRDVDAYERSKDVWGQSPLKWRSGVKHDCTKVMELTWNEDHWVNGFGERVEIESTHLYPSVKTSDVAAGRVSSPKRGVVIPQKKMTEDTALLASRAPKTWAYLQRHAEKLDGRGSSIYRRRPRFSIFGIGDYSFRPWKVAISGLYKQTAFVLVPPSGEKPVILDDTTYFLGFDSEDAASTVLSLLNSDPTQDFLRALTFMDAKRPITTDLLSRLDIRKVAEKLGRKWELLRVLDDEADGPSQRVLFG